MPRQARGSSTDDDGGDTRRAMIVTSTAAMIAGGIALESGNLAPDHCRYCVPNRLDAAGRRELVWDHPGSARLLSDVTANGVIPLLAIADAWRSHGASQQGARDLLLVAEAAALTTAATELSKTFVARRRPEESNGGTSSYWSGHTAFAFSVAVSQATQDSMRGDPNAPWVWAIGLGLASAVGYFRVAGDAHWLTDVVTGAGIGSIAGVATPMLNRRLAGSVTISPAPGGIAVQF